VGGGELITAGCVGLVAAGATFFWEFADVIGQMEFERRRGDRLDAMRKELEMGEIMRKAKERGLK
jgi:hypothetical protein